MTINAHILCYNEERMLPYALRHYDTFCEQIFVHDLGSTDLSKEIAKRAGAIIVQHDTKGVFDDLLNRAIKDEIVRQHDSDWVIAADCDELLYFPCDPERFLTEYDRRGVVVAKPQGYDMVSDKFPTTAGQIYEEVNMGAREDRWYSKPILVCPSGVLEFKFGVGAHDCTFKLPGSGMGKIRTIDHSTPITEPVCKLLHFHHIDSLEAIAAKYDATKARYSEANRKYSWGWQGEGMEHALDKRNGIMAKLQKVI